MVVHYSTHFLLPGTLFVPRSPHKVSTILGTCVAVCLWDPVLGIGGMNHYMLPYWNGDGMASPRYGNIAIGKLLDRMIGMGSNPAHWKAKLFGGKNDGVPDGRVWNVGRRNVILAEGVMKEMKIPVVSSSLGGPLGRKIIFNTLNGEVMMKYIQTLNREGNGS